MTSQVLKSLLLESKDGEWGKSEPIDDAVKMGVVRGTDFEEVRTGHVAGLPVRYIPLRIAKRKTLQPNDIILETAGGSKNRPTGRSVFVKPALIHRAALPLTCASFSRFIRIDPHKADPRYLFWHLQYLYEFGYLHKYHTQHTGVARFQYTLFAENEEFHLPPLSIQRKIAFILSAYDDLIENNTRRIQILEEMAQRIYQEWFVNFRFPGHERVEMVESETGPIPEGWEVKTFSELLEFTLGGDWGSEEPTDKNRCPVTIIRGTDFDDMYYGKALRVPTRYISESSLKKRKLFPGDTIVENSVNASSRSTGRSRLMTQHDLNQINGDSIAASFCKVFRPKDLGIATLIQLHLAYLYDENRMKFYQHVATNGIGNFQAKRFIESEAMSLPTNNESRSQMTGFLTDLLNLRSSIARRNQVLQHTRDLLLPKLISGEVDVEDLDIQVPS